MSTDLDNTDLKPDEDLPASPESSDANPSSLAINYLSASVNTRTGGLSVSITPPQLQGISSMNVDLGISYSQLDINNAQSVLGLPNNWYYSISYIANGYIYINGAQNYLMDAAYTSGMRYYLLDNFKLTLVNNLPLPYDANQQYAYLLSSLKGDNQYFDAYGRMIAVDDKYGNHILYYYDTPSQSVYNCRLDHIIDTYGQTISLIYTSNSIQIKFPEGGKNQVQFSYITGAGNSQLSSYIDPMGEATVIEYNGGQVRTDLISSITYPNQVINTYTYSTIYYKNNQNNILQLDVVKTETSTFQNSSRVNTYDFNPEQNDRNYLGYPLYQTGTGNDALFESDNNNYFYRCQVDNGVSLTTYIYNHLHLLLKQHLVSKNGSTKVSNTTNTYAGQLADGTFPHFTQLPPNYQSIIVKNTEFFNTKGDTRQDKTETTYNNCLQVTDVKEYELNDEKTQFVLVQETETTYDPRFGMLLIKTTADFKPEGTINSVPKVTRTVNTLTADGRDTYVSQLGSVTRDINGKEIFSPEKRVTYEYDPQGRLKSKLTSWDTAANPQPGPASYSYTVGYTYDPVKHLEAKTRYDEKGNASTRSTDTTSGFLLTKKNALGYTVQYTYDDMGRELTRVDAIGVLTKWSYDIAKSKITKHLVSGYETYTYYDGFGNIIRKADNGGTNNKERTIQKRAYDFANRIKTLTGILGKNSVITYGYDHQGLPCSKSDALGNVSTYTYDSVKRTKTSFFNGIKTKTQTYNANRKVVLNELYSSDDDDRIYQEKLFDGNKLKVYSQSGKVAPGVNWISRSTSFNLLNKAISQVSTGWDGIERSQVFIRDLFNRPIQINSELKVPEQPVLTASSSVLKSNHNGWMSEETNTLGQVRTFEYDAVGNNTRRIHFDGSDIRFTYYPNKKVHTQKYKDTNGTTQILTFTYYDGTNLLKSISSDRDGIILYEYTNDGKSQSITYPDGKKLIWTYNPDTNQLTQFTDAAGQITKYYYDDYGRFHQLVSQGETITYKYYDINSNKSSSGQLHRLTYSNGVIVTYTYNGFNLVDTTTVTNAQSQVLLLITYGYDSISKMVTSITYSSAIITDENANYTSTYVYNSLGKLVSEKVLNKKGALVSTTVYTYDAANNVLTKTIAGSGPPLLTSYTYDTDNKLTGFVENGQPKVLQYDTNGNMHKDGFGNTYVYNPLNQLVSYTDNNGVNTVYTYYVNGLRRSKQVGSATPVVFYYDNGSMPAIVNEIQDSTAVSYMIGGQQRYIRFIQNSSGTTRQYIIRGRKDVLFLIGEDGKEQAVYNYDAYGAKRNFSGAVATEPYSILDNPFQFSGEYHDSESDLYYLRSRYYFPRIMRFINRDTIQINNHYGYASGNPVMLTDASGHSPWWSWLLFGLSLIVTAVVTIFSFGTATGAAVAADAIELGAMGADAAVAAGDGAEAGADGALDVAAMSESDGEMEPMEMSDEENPDVRERINRPKSDVNPRGLDHNCPFCVIGYFLRMTATQVAERLGLVEGFLMGGVDNTFQAFVDTGLTTEADFSYQTANPWLAFEYMADAEPGDRFALLYQTTAQYFHVIVAQTGEDGAVIFFDAQADVFMDDMPVASVENTTSFSTYWIIRISDMVDAADNMDLPNAVDQWGGEHNNNI